MRSNAAAKAKSSPRPPVRVRHDPPTLEEAIFAVQGLTDDVEHQAELAAELMGAPLEEARELAAKMWVKAAAVKRMPEPEVTFTSNRQGTQRAVVVERRPAVTVERKGSFKIERSEGVTVERKPFRGLGAPGQPRTLIKLGGR
jgi:hypothetical protein